MSVPTAVDPPPVRVMASPGEDAPSRIEPRQVLARRQRRAVVAICVGVVAGAVTFAGLTGFGRDLRLAEPFPAGVDHILTALGLSIGEVEILGHRFTSDTDVYAALALEAAQSLVTFDVRAARQRIEALPWVLRADIKRVLPGRLRVVIEERQAVAIWMDGGRNRLVDRTGRVLADLSTAERIALPRITGAGAPGAVGALLAAIEPHPQLAVRLVAAHRVGERRWTLELAGGIRVLLPAERTGEALLRLERMQQLTGVLLREEQTVDLRQDGLIALSGNRDLAQTDVPAVARPQL